MAFVREGMVRSGFPWLTIRENPRMWGYQPWLAAPGRPNASVTGDAQASQPGQRQRKRGLREHCAHGARFY
ncbi:MAG TPA: hypothetical protein VF541_04410 [Longimicrobium sp.]